MPSSIKKVPWCASVHHHFFLIASNQETFSRFAYSVTFHILKRLNPKMETQESLAVNHLVQIEEVPTLAKIYTV